MNDKDYTSNIEDERLNIEESVLTMGKVIYPHQIWRDAGLIPASPSLLNFETPITENDCLVSYSYFNDGANKIPLVKKIEKLPLTMVKGTKDAFYNPELKNLIGREFDKENSLYNDSWQYVLYIDNNQLAYDVGKPYIDIASGILKFRNSEFLQETKYDKFFITFYKYIGRLGFIGFKDNNKDAYAGIDLPLRDSVKHFKNSENDSITATLKINGYEGNTEYIFPQANSYFNKDNYEINELGETKIKNVLSGTIVLQENFQETQWEIGKDNGGVWLDNGNVRKN